MFFRYCKDEMINVSKPKNFKLLKYNLPFMFYLYLPKVLAIIFILIINYKSKSDSNEENRLTKRYHFISIQKNKKKILLLVYIISLLEVIQENGDLLLYYYQRIHIFDWLIEKKTGLILFVPFISYFILKANLFNHHILSLILGLIGAFIINFCRFPLGFSKLDHYVGHLLNIFFSSILSLAFVLIKYVMKNTFIISPYLFLFYNGIFNIINSFIYISLEYVIVTNLPDEFEKNNYQGNYFINNYLGIFNILRGQERLFYIYFFSIFVLLFFYYIISALTIYNFNLYLIIIVETCLPIDNDMIEIFYKKEVSQNKEKILKRALYQFIGYIIIIISALILNEILVLNFLGFNKNIRSNISSRSTLDVEGSFDIGKDPEEIELEENNINETNSEKITSNDNL